MVLASAPPCGPTASMASPKSSICVRRESCCLLRPKMVTGCRRLLLEGVDTLTQCGDGGEARASAVPRTQGRPRHSQTPHAR